MSMKTTRTIWSAAIAVAQYRNEPWAPLKNTTLNENFKVFENEQPLPGQYPHVGYLAYGCKGTKSMNLPDGRTKISHEIRSPKFAGLFGPMPWVVRPVENDISPDMRKNYRMRTIITDNKGKRYVAYYLRVIDISANGTPIIEERHVENGIITSTVFEPNPADLAPTPLTVSGVNKNDPNGDCLIVSSKVKVELTQTELGEILNAYEVIYGSSEGASISELAICTAIDRQVTGSVNGVNSNYTEAVCAQIASFVDFFEDVNESSTGIEFTIDVGSSELML